MISEEYENENFRDHTFCSKCKNYILTYNYLIHEARCSGIFTLPTQLTSKILSQSKRNKISQSKAIFQKYQEQQEAPCKFCSHQFTLKKMKNHILQCPNRQQQCELCNKKFPKSLMEKHQIICKDQFEEQIVLEEDDQQSNEQQFENMRRQNQSQWNQMQQRNFLGKFKIIPYEPDPEPTLIQRLYMYRAIARQNEYENNRQRYRFFEEGHRNFNFNHHITRMAIQARQGNRGMSKQEINKFKVSNYRPKYGKEDQMCIICYCQFQHNNKVLTLSCKHEFHYECISVWLEQNSSCPLCKKKLKD